ncbi:MAG: hypothetical protein ACRD99_05725 [Nitrososphaera sp.]
MEGLDFTFDMAGYGALCKAVSELHSSAEVVLVISRGKLAASHIKSGGPAPDEGEFSNMLSQLETVIAAIKANEDKFGDLRFVAIHYKYVDGLFFPIDDTDTLIVGIMPPYDDSFVAKVSSLVEKEKR